MATRYARSTDGSDADDGSTWALAKATLAGIAAIDAAGDRIWVSQAHAESTAAAITLAFAGTLAAPTQLLCGNDAAEPPTALADTATINTTGSSAISVSGSAYIYGLNLLAGAVGAGSNAAVNLNSVAGAWQKYERCFFSLQGAAIAARVALGQANGSAGNQTDLIDCTLKFAAPSQRLQVAKSVRIAGGSLASGSAAITGFAEQSSTVPMDLRVSGFDFTGAASSLNLVGLGSGQARAIFHGCKMPASWSGGLLVAAPTNPGQRVELWNSDNAATNYRMWIEDSFGSIKDETTLVKTGGASDGTTPLAWKMASSANASFTQPLCSPEIASAWIDSTGSAKTITVDLLTDNATALKDDEIWVEVSYLSDAASPKASCVHDSKADILAAGADQAASAATWTTTGMGNPNKRKLEVTFTPEQKGIALVKVCLAKASTTVYVDPVAQVS